MLTPTLIVLAALLALAVVSLWFPPLPAGARRVPAWTIALGAVGVVALIAGAVTPVGIAVVLLLIALCAARERSTSPWLRVPAMAAIAFIALALALHKIPGFYNPLIARDVADGAAPITQYINLDKAIAGIVLIAFYGLPARTRADWRAVGRAWPIVVATPVLVLGLALLTGVVEWAPKLPSSTGTFLASNLLITCVAEEAFFRALVQRGLQNSLSGKRYGVAVAIGVTSIVFGIAHLGGGVPMILLATLAGIGYGLALWRSGRIEAAILTHFVVNALRFLLVAGPVVVRAT
ncbi:lysostaphin resistance A-like protein [Pseudoduganella plicata]|uniref:CAAX amino protease n=1 Tax=Pseudoduganella plicata TaxID=321984 RepID=A0A4V1ATZ3_9BURK|nr:CPBP family intramembrane glutamic endopeptidase [Pseudoduganella plicata]QBQ37368.1 CPBP family intramembrane metalloprotease [Pseudoduganella plicata]GGZ08819.1 CAAX amino protease [Pseudoduganella plicata]